MCIHSNPITNVVRKVRFPRKTKKEARVAYSPLKYDVWPDPWHEEGPSLLEMNSSQIKKYLKNG